MALEDSAAFCPCRWWKYRAGPNTKTVSETEVTPQSFHKSLLKEYAYAPSHIAIVNVISGMFLTLGGLGPPAQNEASSPSRAEVRRLSQLPWTS